MNSLDFLNATGNASSSLLILLTDISHWNSSDFNHTGLGHYIGNHSSSNATTMSPTNVGGYTQAQARSAYYVIHVFYPILLACCTFGNVVNLIVLAHDKQKSSTNAYMMTVAVADLFVLWCYFPSYLYNVSPYLRRKDKVFLTAFTQSFGVVKWLQELSIEIGDWTLIVFSLVRLLAIVRPFNYRWLQSTKAARIISGVLLILAALFTVNNMVDNYYLLSHGLDSLKGTDMDKKPRWLFEWDAVQSQAEIAMTIFKFFAVMVINLLVVLAIRRHQSSHIGKMRAGQETNSARRYRNSNLILLASVCLYLVTQFPSLINNCLITARDFYHTYDYPYTTQLFTNPFIVVTFLTNYSVNFFLYLTVSKRFRAQLVQVFAPHRFKDMIRRNLGSEKDDSKQADQRAGSLAPPTGNCGKNERPESRDVMALSTIPVAFPSGRNVSVEKRGSTDSNMSDVSTL